MKQRETNKKLMFSVVSIPTASASPGNLVDMHTQYSL
jgi:hypothetical protein